MEGFNDFLNFKFLISPYVLIVFYYIGAFGIPLGSWVFATWVKNRYWIVSDVYESGKSAALLMTRKRYRVWFSISLVLIFILLEIMWRMIFEFLIAYLQIRDALLQLIVQ